MYSWDVDRIQDMGGPHSADKKQFLLRFEKKYRVLLEKLMQLGEDKDKTALLKRLIEEEAKRKGMK